MRLDADLGHKARVWHCGEKRPLPLCVWVDDVTHRYGIHAGHSNGYRIITEVQAKLIVIVKGVGLVLIDPEQPEEQADLAIAELGAVAPGG